MSPVVITPGWERITYRGELVYWRRTLGRNRWLAVKRHGDAWAWALHVWPNKEPVITGGRPFAAQRTARAAADRYVRDEGWKP